MVYDNIERLFKQKEIELKASNLILRFWHYYKSCKQGNIKSQIKNYYLLQRGVRDFTIYSKKKRLKEMLIPIIEIMPSTIKNVLIKGHNLEVKVEEDNWNIKDFEEIEQDQKLLKEKMNYLEKIFQSVHKKLLENPNKLTNDQCIRLQQLVFLYNQLNKQDFSSTEDYKQAQIYPNVHKNRTLELLATQLKNKYEESNKFKRDYERIISGVGTFKTMIYRLNIIQTNMAANLNKISYRAIRKYQEKEKYKFLKKKFKHIHKHTKNDDNLDQDIVIDSSVTYLKQMSSESIFTNNNQQKNKQQDNQTSQNNQKHQFLEQKTQQINQKILDQNLHQQLIKDNQLQQKPPKKVTIQLDQDQEKIQEQHIFKSPIRQDDTLFKQNLKQQVPSDKSSDKSPNKQQLEGGKLNFDQSSLQYIKKSNLSKASQDQSLQNLFEYINFDQKKDISHPEIIHYKDKIKEIDQAYDDLINSLQDDD